MSDKQLLKAMARHFERWGALDTEDTIGQQVASAAEEIERGELPDDVVAMFRRANELRAWHKAHSPESDSARPSGNLRSPGWDESWGPFPEAAPQTPNVRAEMIALINVAQQALDSLIVERIELVRLRRSTHDVDMTINAARKQLRELHRAALELPSLASPEPIIELSDRRQSGMGDRYSEPQGASAGQSVSSHTDRKPSLAR